MNQPRQNTNVNCYVYYIRYVQCVMTVYIDVKTLSYNFS